MRRIVTTASGLLALLMVLMGLTIAGCSKDSSTSTAAPLAAHTVTAAGLPTGTTAPGATAGVPARVLATLAWIDAGTWPPNDGSGTHGGTVFSNREGRLPATVNGRRVTYKEWDVNVKKRGQTRDAERIITGSDHSAWYTVNHYQTFTRIR